MLGLGIGNYNEVWVPTDIANCLLWLTTANGDNQMTFSSGTKMNKWGDLSGNDNHASQSTAGKAPDFTAATQSVDFDNTGSASVDDYMDLTTQISLDTSATGWTIAIVCTSSDWDAANQSFLGDKDGNNDFFRHDSSAQTLSIKNDGQTRTITLDTPAALVNDQFYHIMATIQTNGDFTMYIDNVAQTDTESFTDTKDFEIDQIIGKAGASQTLDGAIKSIMVFKEPLKAEDRKGCYEYMTQ